MRTLRLLGEPVHPPLVHIPLAVMLMVPLWDALGVFRGDPLWWGIAFWTLALGLCVGALAALVGFLDYVRIPQRHAALPVATRHLVAMLTGVSVFVVRLVLQGGAGVPDNGWTLLAVSAIGALVVAGGGWLGGQLVYHHGIGVDPPVDA